MNGKILCVLALALLLAGCGSDLEPAAPSAQETLAESPAIQETEPEETVPEALRDAAAFLEQAVPDLSFADMNPEKRAGILEEYGSLLEVHSLLARQSADGTASYILGYFGGNAAEDPLSTLSGMETGSPEAMAQELYLSQYGPLLSSVKYRIQKSQVHLPPADGLILITPRDSELSLDPVFDLYRKPDGRAYCADALSRGISLVTPEGPYLQVYLISGKWGEISERIPLAQAEAAAILTQERQSLEEGYGFYAELWGNGEPVLFSDVEDVPQAVLDLAVEKCGYQFAAPRDVGDSLTQARLDCDWLEGPLYAEEEDLEKLGDLLRGAEFGFVGACGYGAKLTIRRADGSELTLFKGADGCDSMVYGSYGGYFLGDAQNQAFWQIFGLDPETKLPVG